MNYQISREQELTPDILGKILSRYQTEDVPTFTKRYNYYLGKQAILNKEASDEGKPNNRIVTNFVSNIVDTYEGYAVGIPVTYNSDSEGFQALQDILNYNDISDEDAELFREGLIFGRAVEIYYIDEQAQTRFKVLDPREVVPIYENNLNEDLLYAVRYYREDLVDNQQETYIVEVYDNSTCTVYRSNSGFSSFEFIRSYAHNFAQVPFTFFVTGKEMQGIADNIFSLQDAYNSLVSDSIDDWDSWCDAYLVLKNVVADSDDLASMKEHRVLMLDGDASAEYLTKNVSTTEIDNLLLRTETKIREMSCCPNFADVSFGTSSGVAIRYRLLQMESKTSSLLNNFKKALQRRIELLAEIVRLVDGEDLWRDVEITFTRNLPIDYADIINTVNGLRGLVSDETLLSQVPFVNDPAEEIQRVREENQSNPLYNFNDIFVSDNNEQLQLLESPRE